MTKRNNYLLAGVLAGPIYVIAGFVQAITRPGYDLTRNDISLLSNGSRGWIQISNFVLTGILTVFAAIGLRRALGSSKGGAWGPRMLGLYGLGLMAAGAFVADPMNGFPIGTPAGPPVHPSAHGTLHIVAGAAGFLGLIAACFILSKYFANKGQAVWKWFSIATGLVFLAAFIGIAGGSQQKGAALQVVTLAFTFAVVVAWTWVTAISIYFRKIGLRSRV